MRARRSDVSTHSGTAYGSSSTTDVVSGVVALEVFLTTEFDFLWILQLSQSLFQVRVPLPYVRPDVFPEHRPLIIPRGKRWKSVHDFLRKLRRLVRQINRVGIPDGWFVVHLGPVFWFASGLFFSKPLPAGSRVRSAKRRGWAASISPGTRASWDRCSPDQTRGLGDFGLRILASCCSWCREHSATERCAFDSADLVNPGDKLKRIILSIDDDLILEIILPEEQ